MSDIVMRAVAKLCVDDGSESHGIRIIVSWLREILKAPLAMKAKKEGLRQHGRSDWAEEQLSTMRWVQRVKLAQHCAGLARAPGNFCRVR